LYLSTHPQALLVILGSLGMTENPAPLAHKVNEGSEVSEANEGSVERLVRMAVMA